MRWRGMPFPTSRPASNVDAELDAQRTPERELRLERALGEDVHRIPRELGQAHALSHVSHARG